MLLDKALIIKGAAGVAAVGGIATTGGIVFKDQIRGAFSSSPKANASSDATEGKEKPGQNQGDSVQSDSVTPEQQATDNSRDGGGSQDVPTPINQPADGAAARGSQVPGGAVPGGVGASPSEPRESEEEKKKNKMNEINEKLDTLGLGNCHFTEGEITNVDTFSKECDLDQAKFKKIKFSNRGDSQNEVNVDGWGSNINLKIHSENNKIKYTFKDVTSKLTISGDPTKTNIVLKASVEREFEEKAGKLSKVSKTTTQEKTKIKDLNGKLEMINIPAQCRFEEEENDTSIECDVSNQDVLKKIEFLNKEKGADSKIVGNTTGLKMTINRLSDEEGALKHKSGIDLEFVFSGYSQDIKIQDNRTDLKTATADIVLKHNTNPTLTITDESNGHKDRLAKSFNYYSPGFKLGLSCTSSYPSITCTPNKTVKLLNAAGTDIETMDVQDSQTSTKIITVTEDVKDYEQGIKFTVTNPFPTNSPKLEKGDYQAKYVVGKGWALSKKS